jgi:hypothetical protein
LVVGTGLGLHRLQTRGDVVVVDGAVEIVETSREGNFDVVSW